MRQSIKHAFVLALLASNMQPVSVVIPSTGRPQLLEALRSVMNQTHKPREIIVCFDGPLFSGSSLEGPLRKLADSTVQFVELPKNSGGPGKPRNVGIAFSSQPFIATLDDDDSWLPEKLETQMPAFENALVIAVGTNATVVSQGAILGTYFKDTRARLSRRDFASRNPVITSSMVCRKWALLEAGGFNESASVSGIEDYLLWMRLATMGRVICFPQSLVKYEAVSQTSLSASVKKDLPSPMTCALEDVTSWSKRLSRTHSGVRQLRFYSVLLHLKNRLGF
jgi:teichuronic acid biosynthesis glycosyltransferase TuaG